MVHTVSRLQEQGFSKAVLSRLQFARSQSTNAIYTSKWKLFESYCRERDINPFFASKAIVADFMLFLHTQRHLALSTILSYRSAIGHILSLTTDYRRTPDDVTQDLIRSFKRDRPPNFRRTPPWDLGLVLQQLLQVDERELDWHLLTAKTIFLVALASGERRHALAALQNDIVVMAFKPLTLRIQFDPLFIPKTYYTTRNQGIIEPLVLQGVSDVSGIAICPARCVLKYKEIADGLRAPSQTSLFLPHNIDKDSNLSHAAVSRYLVKIIHWAYERMGTECPSDVRAHDIRGIAISLKAMSGVALDDVIRSGHWTSSNMYFTRYRKVFNNTHLMNLGKLPSFSAAGSVLSVTDGSVFVEEVTGAEAEVPVEEPGEVEATAAASEATEAEAEVKDEAEVSPSRSSKVTRTPVEEAMHPTPRKTINSEAVVKCTDASDRSTFQLSASDVRGAQEGKVRLQFIRNEQSNRYELVKQDACIKMS